MKFTQFFTQSKEVKEVNEFERESKIAILANYTIDFLDLVFVKVALWLLVIPIIVIPYATILAPNSEFTQIIIEFLTKFL